MVQYVIEEGRITGFDVHASGAYVVVTGNKGKAYIFRIETGELRGTIKLPLHAKGCCVDPSGLYFVVQVPPFNSQNTRNLLRPNFQVFNGESLEEDFGSQGSHEQQISRTTLLMYEVGTGKVAAEIRSVFSISQAKFSSDGKYLALGSEGGAVSVWAIGQHLYQNLKGLLEQIEVNPDYWSNFPIFLDNYQEITEDRTSFAPLDLPNYHSSHPTSA